MNLPDDLKNYRAPEKDAFEIFEPDELAVLIFAVLIVASIVA